MEAAIPAVDHGGCTHTASDNATLALDLRIRLLETLVGLNTPLANRPNACEASIARRGQAIIAGVYEALDRSGTEAIKRFLKTYDLNKALLVPQLPTGSQSGQDLTSHAKAALILDSETDLKSLDRDLRDIEALDKRGIAGAGKLPEHEQLKSKLEKLTTDTRSLTGTYSQLESQVDTMLTRYDNYVDTVSQIFVSMSDSLADVEKKLARMQREHDS